MRRKREKGHWVKKVETFDSGADARNRAETLRIHKDIAHVKMSKEGERYFVRY